MIRENEIGQNGDIIHLQVNKKLEQGAIITYDPMYGEQLMIKEVNHPNYECLVVTNDLEQGIDPKWFNPNVEWFLLTYRICGEYTPHTQSPITPDTGFKGYYITKHDYDK